MMLLVPLVMAKRQIMKNWYPYEMVREQTKYRRRKLCSLITLIGTLLHRYGQLCTDVYITSTLQFTHARMRSRSRIHKPQIPKLIR